MDSRVKDIIKHFDFMRVQQVMEHLDWFWADSKTESKVPSVGEIILHATELMEKALGDGRDRVTFASGGFHADYEDGIINLQFILEEWSEPGV